MTHLQKYFISLFLKEHQICLEVHADREYMHHEAENKDTHANYSHAFIYTLCMRRHEAASGPLLDPYFTRLNQTHKILESMHLL